MGYISCDKAAELVKLLYHWWDYKEEDASNDAKHEEQCDNDGKSPGGNMQLILHELYDRVEEVCQKPGYYEW